MTSVVVNRLHKRYSITTISKRAKLKSQIIKKWFGLNVSDNHTRYRVAIKDVSFELHKGQSLAFIGRNGAGKSTLLKMISGSLSNDSGSIEVQGSVGGLIELGAGLDATKTGRANVTDRANVLGISAEETRGFVNDVEVFTEIGDQFDDPVNTYSSGMRARLGFAISVTLPFDIMICDEALSVGDARFAAKCLAKVNELKAERIFLFVSHSMSMVQRFCDDAIVLDKGEMVFSGTATDAVAYYENNILHMSDAEIAHIDDFEPGLESRPVAANQRAFLQPLLINRDKIETWDASFDVDEGIVIDWRVTLQNGHDSTQPYRLGFPVFSSDGSMLFSCTEEDVIQDAGCVKTVSGRVSIARHGLHPGVYYLVMAFYEGIEPVLRQLLGEVKISSTGKPYFGIYDVEHEWQINSQPGNTAPRVDVSAE